MAAARPTARPTLTFFELLLRPPDAAFSRLFLLRILDPADELVAGERCDVEPSLERGRVREKRGAQILRKLVDDSARDASLGHARTRGGLRPTPSARKALGHKS